MLQVSSSSKGQSVCIHPYFENQPLPGHSSNFGRLEPSSKPAILASRSTTPSSANPARPLSADDCEIGTQAKDGLVVLGMSGTIPSCTANHRTVEAGPKAVALPDTAHDARSVLIRSASESCAALAALLGPDMAEGGNLALPPDCPLRAAGHVSIAVKRGSVNAAALEIHSVWLGIPEATPPLQMNMGMPSSHRPPIDVYCWDLQSMRDTAHRRMAMRDVARILGDPAVLKVLHADGCEVQALLRAYGICLDGHIADTQVLFSQWASMSSRVLALRATVGQRDGHVNQGHENGGTMLSPPRWPPLREEYVLRSNPSASGSSSFANGGARLYDFPGTVSSNVPHELRVSSELLEIFAACGLSNSENTFAVVASLFQAHLHMTAALHYLGDELLAAASHEHIQRLARECRPPFEQVASCAVGDDGATVVADSPSGKANATEAITPQHLAEIAPIDAALVHQVGQLLLRHGSPCLAEPAVTHALPLTRARALLPRCSYAARRRFAEREGGGGGLRALAGDYPQYFAVIPNSGARAAHGDLFALRDAARLPPRPDAGVLGSDRPTGPLATEEDAAGTGSSMVEVANPLPSIVRRVGALGLPSEAAPPDRAPVDQTLEDCVDKLV